MFEFTEEDLKYNKSGQLSPRQKEWLKILARSARSFSWKGALITIGFALLGLCFILLLFLQNEDSRAALLSDPRQVMILAFLIPLILGILALAIFLNSRNANKLENAILSSVSGEVRFDSEYSSKSNIRTYYVIVGKKKFKFGDDMSSKFKEGKKYKFYYCKAGMYEFVMSYEKVN
jgi:hypothetical protein